MIKFFRELFAPAIFIKGVLRYKQNDFEESKKCLQDAANRKPDIKNDAFFKAVLLLVESKSGREKGKNQFQEALDSLEDSPHKGTDDYYAVVSDLKQFIAQNRG